MNKLVASILLSKFKIAISFMVAVCLSVCLSVSAQHTKLLEFNGTNGSEPWGSLISDGTFLYGMTGEGGVNNNGVIFKILPNGSGYVKLFDFEAATSGNFTPGSLIYDGTFLYGMANDGGANDAGTIFKIRPDGTGFVKLFDFNATATGSRPYGSLFSDGTFLYGMTASGGTNNLGTLFKILPDGTGFVKLLDFNGSVNGASPYGSLISDGTFLYGMTSNGGSSNNGTIFKILKDGTGYVKLLNFGGASTGSEPHGSLLYDGTFLYGMTIEGGSINDGVIFKIRPDGTGYVKLFDFDINAVHADSPFGDLVTDGVFLYGLTYNGGVGGDNDYGTLFKILPDGTDFTRLHDFTTNDGGWLPYGSPLLVGSTLYGFTQFGGTIGNGTIFSYQLPPTPVGTPGFEWAKAQTGSLDTFLDEVTVDPQGNVYTTGSFSETTDFDPGSEVFNLTSAGNFDIYVTKQNPQGDLMWAFRLGGVNAESARAIASDALGNVYIAGTFPDPVDFDPGSENTTLPGPGGYVCKFDTDGNFLWAAQISNNLTGPWSLVIDSDNNVCVASAFTGTTDFDPGAGVSNFTSAGSADIFVLKLSSAGNFVWARRMGSTLSDVANGLAVDAAGNFHITGSFNGTVDFDPGAGTANLVSAGGNDAFILKLDGSGNYLWARRVGSTGSFDIGQAVTLDATGNVLVTGSFDGTVDFDPGASVSNLTTAGAQDVFVLSLTASGNFAWARNMGGTSTDSGIDIITDASLNVYTIGRYRLTADFDPGPGTFNLTTGNNTQMFMSKLDANGDFLWALSTQSAAGSTEARAMSFDASGNLILAGYLDGGTVDFDPGVCVAELTAPFVGGYVIKLNPTSLPGCGPAITSFTPTNGPVGTTVTIIGTRFSVTPADNTIQFNGTSAVVSASSTTSIITNVPTGTATGKITVTVAGSTATSVDDFTITTTTNQPPIIEATTTAVPIEGIITLDLQPLISDPDDNLDPTSLYLVNSVSEQGASASLDDDFILTLDYGGIQFFGSDRITVGVCDLVGECVEQELTIEVGGDVVVYNAVSPDGNGKNDSFIIQYIDVLPETQSNKVTILNRWGDVVFDVSDYNNNDRVFKGVSNSGKDLPSGIYYYNIEYPGGRKAKTGYLSLRR